MIPLVDLHCHLLAGLDDGPRTDEEALAMCRLAYEEGTRMVAATAHQNEHWPAVTPDRIREATRRLAQMLREADVAMRVFPCAEVMVQPQLESLWQRGDFLSVADRQQYLLVEMPHGLFVDLRESVRRLWAAGVRMIVAHPESRPELLHEPGAIEDLIEAGCLVQVSAHNIVEPASRRDERALRSWFRRGIVHVLGSDGHSVKRRPPKMAEAYRRVARWCGHATADRVASTNGLAILQGLPLRITSPSRPSRRWFSGLWPQRGAT